MATSISNRCPDPPHRPAPQSDHSCIPIPCRPFNPLIQFPRRALNHRCFPRERPEQRGQKFEGAKEGGEIRRIREIIQRRPTPQADGERERSPLFHSTSHVLCLCSPSSSHLIPPSPVLPRHLSCDTVHSLAPKSPVSPPSRLGRGARPFPSPPSRPWSLSASFRGLEGETDSSKGGRGPFGG